MFGSSLFDKNSSQFSGNPFMTVTFVNNKNKNLFAGHFSHLFANKTF